MDRYDHGNIEKKWQKRWEESGVYRAAEDATKQKTYVLDMFPYPSGEGLHVGHPKGYIATDVYSRYMRMQGKAVLHPMGWDAFGLPAENFAIKNKIHPRVAVEKNIARFKEQLRNIGFDYDWSREINTTDPSYYKWTQWIFLKLFEKGLAYQSNEPINWCPSCMTGLANEDLENGACERCGTLVEKKTLPQWVLRITKYADRMLSDLDALQWPEHIKESQRNWIGRSEGAKLSFSLSKGPQTIEVFTTRPDTLFGATYMVLAPEHPLVSELPVENRAEVAAYIDATKKKSEIERTAEGKEKTGVELKGIKAINPATKEEIPMFIADYVLGGYGTGAIMAVPAHDERDYAFAQKFALPIRHVVIPKRIDEKNPHVPGKDIVFRKIVMAIIRNPKNNKYLVLNWKDQPWTSFVIGGVEGDESPEEAARREIKEETGYTNLTLVRVLGGPVQSEFYAAHKGVNRVAHNTTVLFELEDETKEPLSAEEDAKHEPVWVELSDITRDRMAHAELDIALERMHTGKDVYTGEGILVDSGEFSGQTNEEAKKKIAESVGGEMTVTYKLRDWVFSRQRYWGEPIPIIHCEKDGAVAVPERDLPVVLPEVTSYEPSGTGESPLATISEWVNTTCPKCGGPGKRETNTMPQWAGSSWYYLRYMDPENTAALVDKKRERFWAPVDMYVGGAEHATRHLIYARFWHKFLYDLGVVSTTEPFSRLHSVGLIIAEDGRKMSKRFGNVINPDEIVETYGADTLRVYELFMGPFENAIAWNTQSMIGARRFIERVFKLSSRVANVEVEALEPVLHAAIKKVGEDILAFKFNTAISHMMIAVNEMEKGNTIGKGQWEAFLKILAPFAPHITEELWAKLGNDESVHVSSWPVFDPSKLVRDSVTVAVQINGKVRASISLSPSAGREEALSTARENSSIAKWLAEGREVNAVYVPGRIINFVLE